MLRAAVLALCLALACAQYDTDSDYPWDQDGYRGQDTGDYGYQEKPPGYYGEPGERPGPGEEGSFYGYPGENPYGEEPYYGGEGPYGGEGSYGGEGPYAEPEDMDMNWDKLSYMLYGGMGGQGVDFWGEMMKNIPWDEILDNSTASGMVPAFEMTWQMLQNDMCYSTVDSCETGPVTFLDCNCVTQFTTMQNDRCNGVTCSIYRGIWDNLARWIWQIRGLNNIEEFVTFLNEEILTSVYEYTCDCKDEIFKAAVSCVSKYETPMLREMMGGEAEYTRFKRTMKKIKWKGIQKFFELLAEHSCSEVEGVPCYKNYFTVWEKFAVMIDNTFTGRGDSCNSYIDIMKWAGENMESEDESITSTMNSMYRVSKKFWCNPKCAESRLENFWTNCCMVGFIKDKRVMNSFISIVNDLLPLFMEMEKKMPKQAKRQLRTMADPLQMCSSNKKTNKVWKDAESNCRTAPHSFYDVFK